MQLFNIKLNCHILRDIDIDLLQNQLFVFDIFIFLYVVFVRCIKLDTLFFISHKVYHLIVNNMINNEILLGIKKSIISQQYTMNQIIRSIIT